MLSFFFVLLRSSVSMHVTKTHHLGWQISHVLGIQNLRYMYLDFTPLVYTRFIISLWCKHFFETVPISGLLSVIFLYHPLDEFDIAFSILWATTAIFGILLLGFSCSQFFSVSKRRDSLLLPLYTVLDFIVRFMPLIMAVKSDLLIGSTLILFAYIFEVSVFISLQERLTYQNFIFSLSSVFSFSFIWFISHAHLQRKGVRLTLTWQLILRMVISIAAALWVFIYEFQFFYALGSLALACIYLAIFCALVYTSNELGYEEQEPPHERMVIIEASTGAPINQGVVSADWMMNKAVEHALHESPSEDEIPEPYQYDQMYDPTPQQRQQYAAAFTQFQEAVEKLRLPSNAEKLDFACFKMCLDLLNPDFPSTYCDAIFNHLDRDRKVALSDLQLFLERPQLMEDPQLELSRRALVRTALEAKHERNDTAGTDISLMNFFRPKAT